MNGKEEAYVSDEDDGTGGSFSDADVNREESRVSEFEDVVDDNTVQSNSSNDNRMDWETSNEVNDYEPEEREDDDDDNTEGLYDDKEEELYDDKEEDRSVGEEEEKVDKSDDEESDTVTVDAITEEDEESDKEEHRRRKETYRRKSSEEATETNGDGYETRSEAASSISSESVNYDDNTDAVTALKQQVEETTDETSGLRKVPLKDRLGEKCSDKSEKEKYILKLNYLFRDARFFVIKSHNQENVDIAKKRNCWATLPRNEAKLSQAYKTSQNVILVFSVSLSGKFAGFARIASDANPESSGPAVKWTTPPDMPANLLGGLFTLDWICRKEIPFYAANKLCNPWNENKPVKVSRDGQEVEPEVGEKLCRLFPQDEEIDITPILRKSQEHKPVDKSTLNNVANFPKPHDGSRTGRHFRGNDRKHFHRDKFQQFRNREIDKRFFDRRMKPYDMRYRGQHHPELPPYIPKFHPMLDRFPPIDPYFGIPPPPIPLPRYYEPLSILPEYVQSKAAYTHAIDQISKRPRRRSRERDSRYRRRSRN